MRLPFLYAVSEQKMKERFSAFQDKGAGLDSPSFPMK